MKWAPAPWALLLLLLAAAPLGAVQAPAIEGAREGVVLSRLPPIFGEEEVRKQLGTGLTTSFAFEASGRDRGAAARSRAPPASTSATTCGTRSTS